MHNNFRQLVDTLETGESGCMAIRFLDKVDAKTLKFGKGKIVIDDSKYITNKFNANIMVLNSHATTITKTYQPVINCNTITQAAKISYMKQDCIRGGDKTEIGLPLKNLIGLIGITATAVWAYFGIIERLNNIETQGKLMVADVEKNTEFRIKWPRGEMGSLPADSEQFMLIEHIAGQIEKHEQQLESGMHNKVNIDFLKNQVEQLRADVEKLKDKVRENGNH